MLATFLKFELWTFVRWAIGSVLCLTSALAILANVSMILRARKNQNRESFVPLIGGLSGVIALVVFPIAGAAKWGWLPLILDFTWLIAALTLLGFLLKISPNSK